MPELARARPGRPSSGARERILDAGLSVLKEDGYAGLTTSKVAARSGENKALIGYHFGSKHGLVAAVAREVSAAITEELLEGIGDPAGAEDLAHGLVDGLARIMDRDEGLARLYFDLASHSVAEPEVRLIMAEMKQGYRTVLCRVLTRLPGALKSADAEPTALYLIATLEGLALEQVQRGDSDVLRRSRKLFVRSARALLQGDA